MGVKKKGERGLLNFELKFRIFSFDLLVFV
jgi:hypothetical protein